LGRRGAFPRLPTCRILRGISQEQRPITSSEAWVVLAPATARQTEYLDMKVAPKRAKTLPITLPFQLPSFGPNKQTDFVYGASGRPEKGNMIELKLFSDSFVARCIERANRRLSPDPSTLKQEQEEENEIWPWSTPSRSSVSCYHDSHVSYPTPWTPVPVPVAPWLKSEPYFVSHLSVPHPGSGGLHRLVLRRGCRMRSLLGTRGQGRQICL
jgi:hypothetical protein